MCKQRQIPKLNIKPINGKEDKRQFIPTMVRQDLMRRNRRIFILFIYYVDVTVLNV